MNTSVRLLAKATLALTVSLGLQASPFLSTAYGQTNISGDIVGIITDAAGAAVPNAQVVVKANATGGPKTTTSDASGNFRVPLLTPDTYTVTATAPGFQSTETRVPVSAGQVAQANVSLGVGASTQTVEVTGATPLLNTQEASISTTFDLQQVLALPNPGNDLTFVAQTAPGSIMNTQGGYGNFSSFGLPATSNSFTVNGEYENDPFLNISNSGASNLLLGNNDISSVTVTSPAYDTSFGGLGGAQISEISKGGANNFHGNAEYWWNGRIMNANDWFNNHNGQPRQFVNANQWAASIGGPVRKDKTFFFINTEGLRVIIPSRGTVYAPSPAYQAATLAAIPASEQDLYKRIFALYNNAPGTRAVTPDSDANVVDINGIASNFAHEWLLSGRVDQIVGESDRLFGHFKIDKGVQPTFTSLLDPIFNVASSQPAYEGQLNETHSFSSNITNQFTFAAAYYRAIFSTSTQAAANAIVPFSLVFLDGSMGNNTTSGIAGGSLYAFPQGRNVTGYQFIDDLNVTRGNHSIKMGFTMRRDDVTDYGPSVRAVTPEAYTREENFGVDQNDPKLNATATNPNPAQPTPGYLTRFRQSFPERNTQPVAVYAMGAYIQDQWKAAPNLTITLGLRLEHNSNPTCITNCFSNLSNNFLSLAAPSNAATPYNQLITSGAHRAFHSFQAVAYEPRFGFAFLPFGANSHTTVRGGFGMFADAFPAQIADSLLNNAPTNVQFYLRGSTYAVEPSLPNSGAAAVAASDKAFRASYPTGASLNSLKAAGIGFAAPAFTSAVRSVSYPMYESYSFSVEQQLDSHTVLSVSYVGNHGYHEPVLNNGINAYGFGSLPEAAPSASFAALTEVSSTASSNYNGAVVSLTRRQKSLSLQFNYLYSHALDEISNGGFDSFGAGSAAIYPGNPENPYNLAQNYGNADYDIRHYISANYVIDIPKYKGPYWLTGGWQVAGSVFHNSGLPFTVVDSATPTNYSGTLYAQQVGTGFNRHCGGAGAAINPCAFATNFVPATDFGQQTRNTLIGSAYTDTDMDVSKAFHIARWESSNLRLGAQFFNLFNHPNFGQPNNDVETASTTPGVPSSFGTITSTVSTPTSILGSGLGGDASPRLVQIKATFTF